MRQKISAQVMLDCISNHLCEDLAVASNGVNAFLDQYDLPVAAVVQNLQGARRALESAQHFMAAALVAVREAS
jgi:hypothetical protein